MIERSERDGIAFVQMTHGKANALDLELMAALIAAFEDVAASQAKAMVLTGQGGIFSAGVDLPRLVDGGVDYIRRFLPALHRLYDTLFHLPKPVIAAVNGHAIAGGCVLACCADLRIGAKGTGRVGVTELLVGVPFPAMAFEVMRFATAPQFFADTILRGATVAMEDARLRGFLDEVVPADQLMARATDAARGLAALPPATFAVTKRQMRQTLRDRMAAHGDAVDAETTAIWTAPETLDHVRGFVARTLRKS